METQHQHDDSHASALFRSFSFEVESRMPPDTATPDAEVDDLAVAVVEKRRKEDLETQERAEWRRYFDPWKPSEYAQSTENYRQPSDSVCALAILRYRN